MVNEWQRFLKRNAGRGKSISQLSREYAGKSSPSYGGRKSSPSKSRRSSSPKRRSSSPKRRSSSPKRRSSPSRRHQRGGGYALVIGPKYTLGTGSKYTTTKEKRQILKDIAHALGNMNIHRWQIELESAGKIYAIASDSMVIHQMDYNIDNLGTSGLLELTLKIKDPNLDLGPHAPLATLWNNYRDYIVVTCQNPYGRNYYDENGELEKGPYAWDMVCQLNFKITVDELSNYNPTQQ